MSKFFFFATVLIFPFANIAQHIVDFENVTFPSGQNYWNGEDETGDFTIHGATFTNSYNPNWFSWSGFAVSSANDVTTAGWLNQYSSYAGSGANQSSKFGLWYANGEISFTVPTQPVAISVTNTTYAALSMKDGDAYAKKFGSIYGANGLEDGTEGKDWFKLTIIGIDSNENATGEIEFYLADFRSSNINEHFILDVWQQIDLSSLGTVKKIIFAMSSSDNGEFGMNTPGYFALDDLKFYQSAADIMSETQAKFVIYPNPVHDVVNIQAIDSNEISVKILTINGSCVLDSPKANEHVLNISNLPSGVYFVHLTTIDGVKTERLVVAH